MGITFYFKKRTTTTRPVISTLLPLPLHSGASRGVAGGILALSLPLVLAAACHLHPLPLLQARQHLLAGNFCEHLVPWFLHLLTSGCPLTDWLWRPGSHCLILGSHETVTIREIALDRVSTPRTLHKQQAKTNHQSF